jgi:hypothetical protein
VRHPLTHVLAVNLFKIAPEDIERTAMAIEDITLGMPGEQKADLYALLREAINRDMSFVEVADATEAALKINKERFWGR